jgi:hypothetical protein
MTSYACVADHYDRFTRESAAKYVHDSEKLIRDHTPPSKA